MLGKRAGSNFKENHMKNIWLGWIGAAAMTTGLLGSNLIASSALAAPKAQAMMAQPYIEYSKVAFDKAAGQKRVLFFAATWCPSCRSADKDINANLKTIPATVMIFKADYDLQTELKTKYGITHQHTFVYVDKTGKAIKTWSGGGTAEILAAIK
jgi:thioredoxin 1